MGLALPNFRALFHQMPILCEFFISLPFFRFAIISCLISEFCEILRTTYDISTTFSKNSIEIHRFFDNLMQISGKNSLCKHFIWFFRRYFVEISIFMTIFFAIDTFPKFFCAPCQVCRNTLEEQTHWLILRHMNLQFIRFDAAKSRICYSYNKSQQQQNIYSSQDKDISSGPPTQHFCGGARF